MSAVITSVNVGTPAARPGRGARATGIGKRPVDRITVTDPGPKRVEDGHGVSGVEGDFVGDGRHHGGTTQAVYAVSREELDHWSAELGRELSDGIFGENLTTTGLDVDAAEVGDRWRVGTAVLEVSGPRIPCATFARRMQEPHWVRRFAERGRSGAYLRVVEPGDIRAGDPIEVRPGGSGVVLPQVLRALLGDAQAARTVLEAGLYTGADEADLRRVAERG